MTGNALIKIADNLQCKFNQITNNQLKLLNDIQK